MSRTSRLLELIQILRRYRHPVSGQALATELGISLRTLYRDIASLQAQGAAIEGEAGVGYILPPLHAAAADVHRGRDQGAGAGHALGGRSRRPSTGTGGAEHTGPYRRRAVRRPVRPPPCWSGRGRRSRPTVSTWACCVRRSSFIGRPAWPPPCSGSARKVLWSIIHRPRHFAAMGIVCPGDPYRVDMGGGFQPWRRNVVWADAVDAAIRPLLDTLAFTTGRRNWGYTFRYGLFSIGAQDFQHIARAKQARP